MNDQSGDSIIFKTADKSDDASRADQFWVDVDGYEGPLHLLLELARKQKVDLLHVSILDLAEQYLQFILEAKSKRIDLAADYLLMASWLAWLKSKLLLPKEEVSDSEESEDADAIARRLSFRLARLEAMRSAIETLNQGDVTGRDVFVRGMPEQTKIIRHTRYDATIYDLMTAFSGIAERKANRRAHKVQRQPVLPLEDARKTLSALGPELEDWSAIHELERPPAESPETPKKSIVASYLSAALELTRDKKVELRQDHPMADVYVRRARPYMKPKTGRKPQGNTE